MNMTSPKPSIPHFDYTPLSAGTIRLLVPDPLNQHSGHAWLLETAQLDPDLRFDALSYTWGPQDSTLPITLNGRLIRVHHNLYTALPHLALRGTAQSRRPIWIDAICINQSDEQEKTEQIVHMNKIYQRAETVWVWLGLADEQDKVPEAITLLNYIAHAGNKTQEDWPRIGRDVTDALGMGGLDPGIWTAALHLMQNTWYRRVWCLQEAALAENIICLCGEHEVAFELLEEAITNAPPLRELYDARGEHVDLRGTYGNVQVFNIRKVVRHQIEQYGHTSPVRMLLAVSYLMAGSHACFLPEDRVRGILGLCSDADIADSNILEQSSVEGLYTAFSRYVLTTVDPSLNTNWWQWQSLAFTLVRREGLPSWVPDLHHQDLADKCQPYRSILYYCAHSSRPYQASAKQTIVEAVKEWNKLRLRGKLLDRVVAVFEEIPAYTSEVGVLEYICQLAEWEEKIAALVIGEDEQYDNPEGHKRLDHPQIDIDTYWRTLLGDWVDTDDEPITRETYYEFCVILREARDILLKYITYERYATFFITTCCSLLSADSVVVRAQGRWLGT
jgi:hypothetical protein